MKKLKIQIPLILPEVPDEKDQCVDKLMQQLEGINGLERVHVDANTDQNVPQLCFHYDPEVISIDRIQKLAEQTGAEITKKFGHKLIEVEGIRHVRHARHIEESLRDKHGVLEASVSASGMIRLEFDQTKITVPEILQAIREEGLDISDSQVSAERFLQQANGDGQTDQDVSEQDHDEGAGHDHSHGGIFGKNTELIFSILSGILLGVGFGLSFIEAVPFWVSLTLYIGAYFFGGFYTAKEGLGTILKGGFDIDFLMLVAAIGAAILGAWAEGALLLFLFSLGHALEHYAMNKARKSISALADLAPKTALLKKNGSTTEVDIEALKVGDVIVVRPNSKIAADGVIIKGSSSVNQAPITGESVPVDKEPVKDPDKDWSAEKDIKEEHRVFSGTINGNHLLEVKVINEASDSTLSRLVKLVHEAQTQKSPTQRFTDKFEKYFVPAVLALVVLLLGAFLVIDEEFSDSFYRAMAVLVAASPCALAISTPSAVLSGVARAAQGGVLIKGGRPLEDLGDLTAMAFDKTGTLTEGRPKLTKLIALGSHSEEEVLKLAVSVERLSEHPLAKAVVRDGEERLGGMDIPAAQDMEAVQGRGVKAFLANDQVYMGNLDLYNEVGGPPPPAEAAEKVKDLESGGHTTMLIRKNEAYIGIIALMDTPRKDAKSTLEALKKIGIRRMVMLTGDNQNVADAVAKEIGMSEAWGSLLPEEKVAAIKKLREKEDKIAMIGDGVNDAPAMATSTVGISMGAAGSDVALETADIALMADRLDVLPFAIGLSRKANNIIKQNLFISLGMVALLIPLTVSGVASIGPAVVMHEGSTLVVVFNALRLLAYKR
ncbi:heavy metal translocating P-type ATPase [Membranicola marinus]|uniref:P-type Zn(2+) transporter n=1 Tax=Membranihabitans marinus TaxID=1227546 RepID=A0A953I0S0_9BACT|nr:heavy metal translocating P-type ATPase [Membranihabitans marinus]MBY5959162.1 heavy metal translocating P-type ATPase [Membranihabitans marinus]